MLLDEDYFYKGFSCKEDLGSKTRKEMKCPCNTECTDCVPGFQKIIDLKNAGLEIYRRIVETKDVNIKTGNIDDAVNTTEDIYILHNTKDTDISSADYWPEIGHNTINCPRCKKILEHAQNLLKKGPTIRGNDVTGICDHCKMKAKPCFKCRQVVKNFVPCTPDRTDIKKERVKHWLTEIGYLLQGINKITDETKRAHSDMHIDQISHDRQRSARKPYVEQLFQPLELDLAGIRQPHIDNQSNDQNKEKKLVAHFPQLEKLETSIVFKDSLKKNVSSTIALFKDDVTLGERSNVGTILKPEKILTSKYVASPIRINSSETVSIEENVDSFEQIFKDTMSGTGTRQSDEIIRFKPNETKQSSNIIISEKFEEIPTWRKRARSVQPLKIKKENKLDTKTKESERTELLKKYHSAETLVIKTHGIREHNLKQANRIIFPRQQSNKQTKQKSSSELIKDTKDKLTRAEEEKNLKKIFYEQSDEKKIAKKKSEKAIDYQESAVGDKQNVMQEAKYFVKSEDRIKDSQKSSEDIEIIEEKTQISEKSIQTAFEKGGYKYEKDIQKAPIDVRKSERDGYTSEKGTQEATKAEKDDNTPEQNTKKTTKDAPQATKYGFTYEKGAKKSFEDAKKVEEAQKAPKDARTAVKGGYKSEKGTQITSEVGHEAEKDGYKSEKGTIKYTKDTHIAVKDGHTFERGDQNTSKDAHKSEKDGYTFEKGAKKSTKGTQITDTDGYTSEKGTKKSHIAEKYPYKFEKGAQTTSKDVQKAEKDAQVAEIDGYAFEKGTKKSTKDAQIAEKDGYKFEKGTKKSTKDAQVAEIDGYTSEKGAKESTKATQIAEKDGHKFEKGTKKSTKDTKVAEIDGYTSEKGTKKSTKDAQVAEIDGYTSEKGAKESTKATQIAEKDGHKFEKGTKKSTKDAQVAEIDGYTSEKGTKKSHIDEKYPHKLEKGAQNTADVQKAEKDGYASEKGAKKFTKDAQVAEKDDYKFEKGTKKSTKDGQVAEIDGYTPEKSAKKSTKATQIAEKDGHKFTRVDQKTPKDAKKAEKDGYTYVIGAKQLSEDDAQNAERGSYTSKKKQKKHTQKITMEPAGLELEKKDFKLKLKSQAVKKQTKAELQKITMEPAGLEFEKQDYKSNLKNQAVEKKTKDTKIAEKDGHKFTKGDQKTPKDAQKAEKDGYTYVIGAKQLSEDDAQNAERGNYTSKKKEKKHAQKITMEPTGLELEKQDFKLKLKSQAVKKQTKVELPSTEVKKKYDQELKLNSEKEKTDAFNKKKVDEIKLEKRLGAQPITHDLLKMKSIKVKKFDANDDLILRLVEIKNSTRDGNRLRKIESIKDMRLPANKSQVPQHHRIMYPPQSETCLLWNDDSDLTEIDEIKEPQVTDVIIGPHICKIRPQLDDVSEIIPPLHKSGNSSRTDKKQEIAKTPETSTTEIPKEPPENENHETILSIGTPRTMKAVETRPQSPGTVASGTTSKGYVRYTLSDRTFIDNGWTLLPTEKVVRKMNVYRMRPARPEFDWFEHNKNKRLMEYDTGEKLAEFDDNGRGRWFYRNGRMALDYYDAEELNAGQRFVIYSNGEPDERGRSRPYTLLATFDFAGNGIVFDHRGKIRLKYNQTEGVVLDRSIGPVSHWKWHTLNDPPVLQQVMIDTQIAHKDPKIMKMGGPNDNKPRKDNDEMLAIEFDNFIKEKSKKLSQTFKPFQIKMKALKINEHFSLRVLDQATVYLLYRDGTTNLKLNIGMVLDQKEIVDTDTAEVGEVSSSMEKLPARTESLAGLQKSVAHAQHYDWKRTERERKMHPTEPSASVDKLVAGISRPSRPPPRPFLSQSTSLTTTAEHCKCSRKPTSTSVYYDTRFY